MRLSRVTWVLALAGWGCVGQIPTRGTGGGSNGGGGPGDIPMPVGNTPPTTVASCGAIEAGKPRIWRLTKNQMRNSLKDVFGYSPQSLEVLPAETRLDGEFANESAKLTVAPLVADEYFTIGSDLGAEVVRRSGDFVKCPIASLGTGSCLGDFLKNFGLRAWRRPLSDVELGKLTNLYNTTAAMAGGPEIGLQTVVQALFMSPNFLYRSEVGNSTTPGAVTTLTDWELASELSYTLWDSAPDQTLLDLAAQGKLHDHDTLIAQAMRMWNVNGSQGALNSFFQQWLQTEDLLSASKDPSFSIYNMDVAADLQEEERLYLNSVVFDQGGDRTFRTLFTAGYGFLDARTAPVYGVANMTSTALTKTNLDPSQRKGLLTMAGFISAHSDGDDTAIVSRGRYFRGDILCDHVPPPPDPKLAVFGQASAGPNMTNRERLIAHVQTPACAACHDIFDPIGFAMENYDPIGRFRTMDKGKVIDPSGTIPLGMKDVTFTNYLDLLDQLSKRPELYECFSTQYLSYSTGRSFDDLGTCERKSITDQFAMSGYRVDSLVMSIVNSPSFTTRTN